jgi:C4-dicarboxylate-specific signal transduction histidine kinase
VEGHNIQLIQVVLNLLSNAVDAVENLDQKWIDIKTEVQAGQIYLRVVDSGTGIPDAVVQKLMDLFFSTKEGGKETGLGLSISKKIIEDHNGRLEYELHNGNTSFVVILPQIS